MANTCNRVALAAAGLLTCSGLLTPVASLRGQDFNSDLPISLDADSSDFDRRNNRLVFRGLRLTQGDLGIEADRAQADRLDFDDSQWNFSGNVHITMGRSEISADKATLHFLNHQLNTALIEGQPATFRAMPTDEATPVQGQANKMSYDVKRGIIRFSEGARLKEGDNELTGTSLTYDMTEEKILAQGDTDTGERVQITITPPADSSLSTGSAGSADQ